MAEFDCIVVGGGPAGLTAAIYLARFHLSVALFDDGRSRAGLIPLTRNLPGYPVGIGGRDLLRRMRSQAEGFGVQILGDTVDTLASREGGFDISAGGQPFRAAAVLLATGVVNLAPDMDEQNHDDALRRGLLRYCPVCDGYEVTDRAVAVLGTGAHAMAEAEFLRSYSAQVTLVAPGGPHRFGEAERRRLAEWQITLLDGPAADIVPLREQIELRIAGTWQRFDTLYVAFGTELRSRLAATAMRNAICAARPLRR